ncbi:Helitron like N domain-containing protein [Aphis craccivora]|uniref:Helitron like N domain-containing protein n=1 Tax=Aphis craccivora TaxID=307492 RepID=A0A6G0Y7S3_APHCR|nr:Helitron like N domain-containing protein [Aphis craccivora]
MDRHFSNVETDKKVNFYVYRLMIRINEDNVTFFNTTSCFINWYTVDMFYNQAKPRSEEYLFHLRVVIVGNIDRRTKTTYLY